MLEKLAEISWEKISHADGAASDLPDHLRALASLNPCEREIAFNKLYRTILHQGRCWQASAYVVPFLFELLANDNVADKARIIQLLISLAIGYEEDQLPYGFNPDEAFRNAADQAMAVRFEQLSSTAEWIYQDLTAEEVEMIERITIRWARDAYDAVADRAEEFLVFINNENSILRNAAIAALSWFPNLADKALPTTNISINRAA